jgi:hypothetical protein
MKKRKKDPRDQFTVALATLKTNCVRLKGLVANQRPGYARNINEIADDITLNAEIMGDLYFGE